MYSIYVDDNNGWGGGFYWQGGGAQVSDSTNAASAPSCARATSASRSSVAGARCNGSTHPAQITVETITLVAQETQDPWLVSPDGLWQATGWVRGTWPLHFSATHRQGVCSLSATLNGQRGFRSRLELGAEPDGLAPVRGTGRGSDGFHVGVRPGPRSSQSERHRCGRGSRQLHEDGRHRQQHAQRLVLWPYRCAVYRGNAVRHAPPVAGVRPASTVSPARSMVPLRSGMAAPPLASRSTVSACTPCGVQPRTTPSTATAIMAGRARSRGR